MFKEIELELMSIISDDPIDKIAHIPSKEIAKTMDLIYNIKFDDIERVYTETMNKIIRMVVIYKSTDEKKFVGQDLCPINGKVYHITFIPSFLLNKDENNAITLSKSIITYTSFRVKLLMDEYSSLMKSIDDTILDLVSIQAIPIMTCAIVRNIYSGPSLPKVIYMALCEMIPAYKKLYSEDGVNTILNLFDEGLGVEELIDSGFICSIPVGDPKYPGIWGSNKKED